MNFITTYQANQGDFLKVFKDNKIVHLLGQTEKTPDTYIRELAQKVGIPLIYNEEAITGRLIPGSWLEIKYDAKNAQNAYKNSNKSHPLHTDYCYFPFEIYASFLYCVEQAEFGGATTFIDVDTVVKILKAINPKLLEQLQNKKITFGRASNALAPNTDYILSKDELGWKINWSYFRASGDTENKSLVDEFKYFLDTYIEKSGELHAVKLQPGEGVFWHDNRILHGRNSFLGNRQLNKGAIAESVPEWVRDMLLKMS